MTVTGQRPFSSSTPLAVLNQDTSPTVLILVGTQTGNAERLASRIAAALTEEGVDVHLADMWDVYPERVADFSRVIVCTSTWGEGELPDNAVDLFEGLKQVRPNLSHIRFAVAALGDHEYDPHFCTAGRMFDELLTELGAHRTATPLEINEGPTEQDLHQAESWGRSVIQTFERDRRDVAWSPP